ncbi:MAG: asparagine synthase (glutamine-hydrolyzing) [Phototrophicaceae bacterium]
MCGICGVVQADNQVSETLLRTMNDTIHHRGPDGEGYYIQDRVGLAMRRLAIIDVGGSEQPLYNEDKSIVVVFNGEIYNYQQLRQDLIQKGHTFRTDGDGETIVHLYEEYGQDFPKYLRGQFGIGLWDSNTQNLFLTRDRYGQKPVYYYHHGDTLIFASEIKALLKHPSVPCESAFDEPRMLANYLSYGYIPTPETAFKNIYALEPAHILKHTQGEISTHTYWDIPHITNEKTPSDTIAHYIEMVHDALYEATDLRMIADVPLGAFLSGGLDSSLIVALMQKMTNQQVKTFSIGFSGDDSFDESPYAQEVADYLDTEHIAFRVEPHAMDLLEKLVWHHDQPFADSSAIPTFLVSDLTRQHVTVALTGDGGDEQFAGYDRFYASTLLKKLEIIPKPLWNFTASVLGVLPEGTGYYNRVKRAGRFARGASKPLALAYFDWVRIADAEMVKALANTADSAGQHFQNILKEETLAGILMANQASYLPDDLLIKTDRCSMASSLEARAPFLDHKLAEIVAPMPINLKLNGSTTKYILKEVARTYLPDHIIDRKKHGFGVPLGAWLRKDISPVKDLLLSDKARQRNLLNINTVEKLIQEHESGQRDNNRILWTLLTLEQWHREFIDNVKK